MVDLATAVIALIVVVVIVYIITVIHAATMRSIAREGAVSRPEDSLIAWPKWLSAFVGGLLVVWLLYRVRGILLPFIAGGIIAYVLHPAIDQLERRGWARGYAIGVVFGVFLLLFAIGALLVIPAVAAEAQGLSARYGGYVDQVRQLFEQTREKAVVWGKFVGLLPEQVSRAFSELWDLAQNYALGLLKSGLGLLGRSLTLLSLLVITPVVAFWLLRDYRQLRQRLLRPLPGERRERVLGLLGELNRVVAGYLLGMAMMALIVGIYAVVVLTLARVPFAVLLGIITGVLSIIPYLGYPTAMVIVLLVMLVTGQDVGIVLIVLGLLVGGNMVSDYVVAPRVVGPRVGLHPLAVIFAMLAGGSLLGFAGVVLAVPLAGAIKVVAMHFWPEVFAPAPAPSAGGSES